MIPNLFIENYRRLTDFQIEKLNQINLITGKNKTGKTTILEAIAIFTQKASVKSLIDILKRRDEYYKEGETLNKSLIQQKNVEALSSLFFNNEVWGKNIKFRTEKEELSVRLIQYHIHYNSAGQPQKKVIETDAFIVDDDLKLGILIKLNGEESIQSLNEGLLFLADSNPRIKTIYSNEFSRIENAFLWDTITLTEKEDVVISALQIVESNIKGLAFVEKAEHRIPIAKIAGQKQTIPLKSMGDGINRILSIILAMVNAENGYLLIDEFENGLHHSVQEKLWEIIFKLAKDLNIQVFATTHSRDTIESFENVLNDEVRNYRVSGKLTRLENKAGKIQEVSYSPEELKIATDNNIETR
jgi:AAA15 family ATPase/GTPase